jgi:hypothetical protein
MKFWRWLLRCGGRGLWLGLLLATLSPAAAEACHGTAKPMVRLELVFGLGHGVTEKSFMRFLAKEVTPRFPEGLSLFEGYGQWRNSKGRLIKEPSRLLLIWHAADSGSDAKVEAIRAAYKKRFRQESVLRAEDLSCVSF